MANKLIWTLTDYGLNRLSEVQANTGDNLYLQKIKVGDANNSYYVPTANITSLKNLKDSFMIHGKELVDGANEVIFKTVIPETSAGYDIVEVGLYETVGNIDYLFALGVGEPLKKPLVEDNYAIAINYNIKLHNANLASVYDRIMLDPQSQFMTENDLIEVESDILYISNNLSRQVAINTNIIGLDQPEVLNQALAIENNIIGEYFTHNLISNIYNFTSTENNVNALWSFNHLKNNSDIEIHDFSNLGINLKLNKKPVLFTKNIYGLTPFLDINNSNYFYLESDVNFDFLNSAKDDDSPETIFVLIKHTNLDVVNHILTKVDLQSGEAIFDIYKGSNNCIEVLLYTDLSNYIKVVTTTPFTDTDPYVLAVRYNGDKLNPIISIFINGVSQVLTNDNLGTYIGMQNLDVPLTSYIKDSGGNNIEFLNSQLSFIGVVKESFSDTNIKLLSFNMLAGVGRDICLTI